MTKQGDKLAGVDPEQLRQQLRRETNPKAIKRLTTALMYTEGMSPYEIEGVLGFPAQTIYDWLDVVTERDLVALGDVPRPPNASKLTPDQWNQLTAVLNAPPSEVDYTDPAWTPELVHDYITETFDVEYSRAHVQSAQAGRAVQTDSPATSLQGRR